MTDAPEDGFTYADHRGRPRHYPGVKYRFWRRLHRAVNKMAWRFARPPTGRDWGDFQDHHLLWRMNQWCANRWVDTWLDSDNDFRGRTVRSRGRRR